MQAPTALNFYNLRLNRLFRCTQIYFPKEFIFVFTLREYKKFITKSLTQSSVYALSVIFSYVDIHTSICVFLHPILYEMYAATHTKINAIVKSKISFIGQTF